VVRWNDVDVGASGDPREAVRVALVAVQREAVGGHVALLERGTLRDAVFVFPLTVQEVATRLGTPANLQAVLLAVSRAERSGFRIGNDVEARDAVTNAGAGCNLRQVALRGVGHRGDVAPRTPRRGIVIAILHCRLLGVVRPLRSTGNTTLGGD